MRASFYRWRKDDAPRSVQTRPHVQAQHENPSVELLLEAGEAVAALFERCGYKRMASERSQWQLKPKR